MKWYWHLAGGHVHVRVFMNGGKCGDLCFRKEEFDWIRFAPQQVRLIEFIEEAREESVYDREAPAKTPCN